MLVVEVFAPLGEADGGKALGVEAGVVAAAEEAVATEDQNGMEGGDHLDKIVVGLAGRRSCGDALRGGTK